MRKIATIFFVWLCFSSVWAKQLTQDEAWKVARSFFNQSGSLRSAGDISLVALSGDLIESSPLRSTSAQTAFYVFNQGNSYYAIVSGDDRMKPILAYSHTGAFVVENIPSNMKALLTAYHDLYMQLDKQQNLPKPLSRSSNSLSKDVQPLLGEINWNQDEPYFNLCPEVNGKRSVSGCVATAMAMVMKYFEYPQKGIGSHSYNTSSGIKCSFDFGATSFDWGNMLPQYVPGKYTDAQGKAVAELMYACGVAVDMEYSPDGSGAYSGIVADALIQYFGYNKNMGYVSRNYFNTQEWMDMVKKELNEKRPILYNGASKEVGHEFVLDGYDKNNLVHVNWGWGGMNNGYFEIASLEPTSPGIGGGSSMGGGYIFDQGMIIGMQPESESTSYTSYFSLEELKTSKTSFNQNESFDLTAVNLRNITSTFHNGEIGVIAEDKDGVQHLIKAYQIKEEINNINEGFPTLPLEDIMIPSEIKDGTYTLYIGTKEVRESQYSRVRSIMGSETAYILTIKNKKCELNIFSGFLNLEKDLNVSIQASHGLYTGMNGEFELIFSNSSTQNEFYGIAGVMLLTQDKEPEVVTVLGETQLLLPANTQEQKLLVSGNLSIITDSDSTVNIPEGEYFAAACVQWGNYLYAIGDLIDIQIKSGKPCEKIIVEKATVAKSKIGIDEPLEITADILLDGEGDVYNNIIIAAIFAEGQTSTQNMHSSSIFIERDNLPYKLSMSFNPNVTAGKYAVVLYQYINGQFVQLTQGIPFEVSATPTGIEEISDVEGLKVFSTPSSNELRIRTSSLANTVTIYSIAGQMVHQEQLTPGIGNNYSFQVNHLNKGIYIMVVKTTEGKTYSVKFRKE